MPTPANAESTSKADASGQEKETAKSTGLSTATDPKYDDSYFDVTAKGKFDHPVWDSATHPSMESFMHWHEGMDAIMN